MLGTHRQPPRTGERPFPGAATGVAHEGYGGWSWVLFVSRYESEPRADGRKGTSPFVYLGANGKTRRRCRPLTSRKNAVATRPTYVTFLLGINDCFSADPEDPDPKHRHHDGAGAHPHRRLPESRARCPVLGICLTTPPNAREESLPGQLQGQVFALELEKRIQHRLVERETPRPLPAARDENIFLVPTHLNLDPTGGYPDNNGVHPNELGYNQIGASIYSWLKARLHESR